MSTQPEPLTARIQQLRHLSPIWLVPIVAALIGLWLVYTNLSNQGPLITLTMPDAEGIIAGKTTIKARSVEVGTVQSVRLSEDLGHVEITARMAVDTEGLLRQDSQLWVVKPRIERQGISGLGTLLSGAYIELQPGKGNKYTTSFHVLDTPPVAQPDDKGVRIQLTSELSRGLSVGDPVMYRGYNVGRVEKTHFSTATRQMEYQLFIFAPYDSLVTSNSRFWMNGGLRLETSSEGIRFETGTLESMVRGGINFDVPEGWGLGEPVKNGHSYVLFADQASSRNRDYNRYLEYVLLFDDSIRGLAAGAPVEFRGIRIGTVRQVPFRMSEEQMLGRNPGQIPVLIRIEQDRFDDDKADRGLDELRQDIEQQIRKGLRGSLKIGNLLTGALYVDLNYTPDASHAAGYGWFGEFATIPTVSGGLARIEQQVNRLLTKVNDLPLETTLNNMNSMLKETKQSFAAMHELSVNMNKIASKPETGQLPADLQRSMQELQKTLHGFSAEGPMYRELNRSVESLDQLLRELHPVVRQVNDKPNSLIFSTPPQADPQPKRAAP